MFLRNYAPLQPGRTFSSYEYAYWSERRAVYSTTFLFIFPNLPFVFTFKTASVTVVAFLLSIFGASVFRPFSISVACHRYPVSGFHLIL
jgi:hypothetical protein